jgi:hypothetical protein
MSEHSSSNASADPAPASARRDRARRVAELLGVTLLTAPTAPPKPPAATEQR